MNAHVLMPIVYCLYYIGYNIVPDDNDGILNPVLLLLSDQIKKIYFYFLFIINTFKYVNIYECTRAHVCRILPTIYRL